MRNSLTDEYAKVLNIDVGSLEKLSNRFCEETSILQNMLFPPYSSGGVAISPYTSTHPIHHFQII